jgi:hypothetical protein
MSEINTLKPAFKVCWGPEDFKTNLKEVLNEEN